MWPTPSGRSGLVPKHTKRILVEESGGKVGLRIEVDREDSMSEPLKHVRQMIGEGCLADAPFVVEHRDGNHTALLIVTVQEESSMTNSGLGLPFRSRELLIRPIPRPNWLTYPSDFIAAASEGFR